jgi:hypothetical protein
VALNRSAAAQPGLLLRQNIDKASATFGIKQFKIEFDRAVEYQLSRALK